MNAANVRRGFFAVVLLLALKTHAHDADIIFVNVRQHQDRVVSVELVMTKETVALLAPGAKIPNKPPAEDETIESQDVIIAGIWNSLVVLSNQNVCPRSVLEMTTQAFRVHAKALFHCSKGEMAMDFRFLNVLPSNYQVMFSGEMGGSRRTDWASYPKTSIVWGTDPVAMDSTSVANWLRAGMFHIWEGADHLLFLIAVVLSARTWRQLLGWTSAFTVAHAIVLGLAIFRMVCWPEHWSRYIELTIALSICFVALENILERPVGNRGLTTFGFGLIHGVGLSNAFHELSANGTWRAFVGFNVGVELGQSVCLCLLWPLIRYAERREKVGRTWTIRGSYFVLLAGLFWSFKALGKMFV